MTTRQTTPDSRADGTRVRTRSDPNRVRFAVNKHRDWVHLRWTGMENPHVLIVGGSQSGKTTVEKLIAAVAASQGCIVIVLDPKLRFAKFFRDLPHVLVYRSQDPHVAAQEWDGVLGYLVTEMQRRYQLDEEADTSILADHARFPTIIVMADEFGVLQDFADKEWPHRRPDNYKGDTPLKEHWHTLMRMGAEARIICVAANQAGNADELPAGTKTRALCGQRIVLGNSREDGQWRLVAGNGVPKPPVPDGVPGAGLFMVGANGAPQRIQCGHLDSIDELRQLAARGVPLLYEQGHVTGDGQLLLGDVAVPRPGRMAAEVAAGAVTPEPRNAAGTAGSNDGDQPPSADPGRSLALAPVVGNEAGAEFCGMTVRNFRSHRDKHPIPGEHRVGNAPAWPQTDLGEWAMHRSENRRNTRKEP